MYGKSGWYIDGSECLGLYNIISIERYGVWYDKDCGFGWLVLIVI